MGSWDTGSSGETVRSGGALRMWMLVPICWSCRHVLTASKFSGNCMQYIVEVVAKEFVLLKVKSSKSLRPALDHPRGSSQHLPRP